MTKSYIFRVYDGPDAEYYTVELYDSYLTQFEGFLSRCPNKDFDEFQDACPDLANYIEEDIFAQIVERTGDRPDIHYDIHID